MTTSDAFALKNSGLNQFLFSEVGTEENGSSLTILSMLARLGRDPWAETARWTELPRAAIIDRLADSISQMPLRPQALKDARGTATRLILLLPARMEGIRQDVDSWDQNTSNPTWLPYAVLVVTVGFWILTAMIPAAAPLHTVAPSAITEASPGTK